MINTNEKGLSAVRCDKAHELSSTLYMNTKVIKKDLYGKSSTVDERVAAQGDGVSRRTSHSNQNAAINDNWGEMEPLFSPRKDSIEYPHYALTEIVHDAIIDIHRLTQAPIPMIASSVLASANLAVQAHVDVETRDGRRMPTSLSFLTEALSGERKSTVDKLVLAPHHVREAELQELSQQRRLERQAAHYVWEDRRKAFLAESRRGKGGVSPSDVKAYQKAFLEKVGVPPEPWEGEPLLLARDLTSEGLVRQLMVWPSMGIFSDEGGVFFGGITMNQDNALKTTGTLSELWDGKGVNRLRVHDGVTVARDKRLAMHLLCQPVVFQKFIAHNSELKGQGFLPRCLITRVKSRIGYRPYKEIHHEDTPALQRFLDLVTGLLRTQPIGSLGGKSRVQPRVMRLSDDAHELYVRYYNEVEERQRPNGEFREITGTASKVMEQTLRLSATLQLLEDPQAEEIDEDILEAAFQIIMFHLHEVLRMDQEGRLDPDLVKAQVLLNWIVEERMQRVKPSQVIQKGPNRLRGSTADAKRYLQILADHGYLRLIPNATTSKWVEYLVNPKLNDK